ncbi:neuronal cell adhesion molecule isoform X1 [Strongylocentrotus purpuratus]|uniref:Neuronal cell adhesion molecule n=1 Tax=Strongylocentrotus purpuratus TaxID=7668 RepID=A0A7M7MZT2_STRPU|nr:neuronal cell adhesion molecule isoform X1 [Strongylocentrotus purpuratus]XP_030828558.1 neuronal cell adhesion molecule isoform X1 [Strongylocentrotus purpuratus]XP_030828559.1 neuronal cell adhesion molecule isoform X1 [Strongylocentrotus purpuratus]
MNSFSPICLLLCIATLTLAFFPRVKAQVPSEDDVPPSIVEQPESINGDTRLPLTLTCRATGIPEPSYYWYKDGALFDVDNNDRASLDGGNLVIESLTTADDGQYQCFANNRLGTAMSQKIMTSLAFMDQFENTEPETVQVDQGRPLKLQCGGDPGVPNGNPAPLIYWTDAAAKPTPITYNARINQDPLGNLVFSNVIEDDAKGYYCQAINNVVGSSQRSPKVTLAVSTDEEEIQNNRNKKETAPKSLRFRRQNSRFTLGAVSDNFYDEPPTLHISKRDLPPIESGASLVTKPAASEIAIRTQSFKLKCIAYGYPTPEITWKRGEEQLQSGGRISIEESGQELVISTVENSDKGTYTCVASNEGGQDEFSTVVTVESAPYFPAPPSDETKGPGESVDIECRSEGVPAPTVVWLVNGQPWADFESNIDAERWTVVTGNPQLATISISNLQTTDSNVFQCIATNKYKEELTSVVLNVVSIPARIPSFTPVTRKLSVVEDSSAAFTCHVEGRPTPTITWTFKGSVLTNGDKYTIDEPLGSIVINNALEVDSGAYECTAENSIDGQDYEATGSATLTVLGKTIITLPPADLTVREDTTATFQCEITYDHELDKPETYWMKDGQRLEANQDNSLRIDNAMFSNSGTYTCFVETTLDESTDTVHSVNASAQLVVKGHPGPPQNLQLRAKEQEFAMDLFWEPGNDNNAPIQYYIIQYDTKWADMHWQFQANETAANVSPYRKVLHLQPFVDYKFRVIAVNEIGESEPSAEIAPTVDPQVAPPSKNPIEVSGSGTRPESMVIRWQSIHPFYYGGDDFHYEVAYRPRMSSEPFVKDTVYPENTDANPTGIIQNFIVNARKPYEEYEFSVRSMNSGGPGPEPEIHYGFSGEAAPGASPSGVTVEAISANEVNVTWEPIDPEDANGKLGGYNVYYNVKIASGQDKQMCVKSPCVVGNLQAATTYEITVKAFTNAGEGPASDVVEVVTDSAPPGPVYKLKVDVYSYRLVLNWQEPILTNGDLTGYNVIITPVVDETLGDEENLSLAVNDDLTLIYEASPETKYRVEVLALNAIGDGEKTTEEPTTALQGRPSKPSGPAVDGIAPDHANFTWDLSNLNPTASAIEIQYRKKADDTGEFASSEQSDVLDQDLIMVSGLESSTTYQARLRVTNQEGSTVSTTTEFKTTGTGALADGGFVLGTWMIILICIIILLILILLIICIIKSQKGGKYNVSDKEKQLNKDIESTPLKDDGAFDEYKPPTGPDGEPLRGSQGSLNDSEHGSSETDSLKEYADGETGKFDEEGSFIGQYGDNKKQRQPDDEQGGGAAYSTFV